MLTGTDEISQKITGFINEEKIRKYLESEQFVVIKVQSGSDAYMQFVQICNYLVDDIIFRDVYVN